MKSLTIQHSTQLTAPLTYTKRGVLMLRGLGVKDPLHPDFTRLLTNQQLEVYTVERKRDQEILLAPMEIVQEYVTQTRLAIQELLDLGKEVHLMGISFWGFIALETIRTQVSVSSLALVAPVLYPDRALHSVLQSVTSDMAQDVLSEVAGWTPPQLHLPTVAIFGGADTIAPKWETDFLKGKNLLMREIPVLSHGQISKDPLTHETLAHFYKTHSPIS